MALLTVNEVANRTGYCTETIRIKIRAGVLPAVKRGKRYMIQESDLGELYAPVEGKSLYVNMREALDV